MSSTEELRSLFDPNVPGSGTRSNALALANKPLWLEKRRAAIEAGILQPQDRDVLRAHRAEWDRQAAPRQYSREELTARARWPEEVVKKLLVRSDYFGAQVSFRSLAELKETDPKGYAQLQLAAASFGIGGKSIEQAEETVRQASKPLAHQEAPLTFLASPEMVRKLGFKEGELLSKKTFENAIDTLYQMEEAAKAKA